MKIKGKSLLLFLIALFTVLSHSIYAYLNNRIIVNSIYVILSFLPVFYCVIYGIRIQKNFKRRIYAVLLGYYIIVFAYGLFRVDVSKYISYACRYVLFLPFMLLVLISLHKTCNEKIIFKYISNILLAIAIISLFFWIFGTELNIIPPTGQVWAVWGNSFRDIYLGVYLEVPGNISGTSLHRNVGIFCEAPAFAYFLSIGFGYEILVAEKSELWKKIVYVITLVTTGTTTGLLILLYVIFTKVWDKLSKNTCKNIILRVGVLFIAFFSATYIYRFAVSASKMASVMIRLNDYINGFMAWLNNPLLGVGYMAVLSNTGFSNSITQVLVSGGILHAIIYITGFVGALILAWRRKEKRSIYWILMCGLLFSISIVGYAYTTLFILASQFAYFVVNGSGKK